MKDLKYCIPLGVELSYPFTLIGLQWIHEDFTAKKNEKGKKAKAVVNMSLGGAPGQVGTSDEVIKINIYHRIP